MTFPTVGVVTVLPLDKTKINCMISLLPSMKILIARVGPPRPYNAGIIVSIGHNSLSAFRLKEKYANTTLNYSKTTLFGPSVTSYN